MNTDSYLLPGERFIPANDPLLQYSGRIDELDDGSREMIYPCSYVKWHYRGTECAILVSAKKYYFNIYAGAIVDANQVCMELTEGVQRIDFCKDAPDTDHIITFFKRQDACNTFTILGIILPEAAELTECPEKPARRIEVYGDSVSAGEVSEAVMYIAQPDPEGHEGCYSNSWYSYSWLTARKLKAELHDIAQGGIALLEGTGWFAGPDFIGLEQTYDKIKYYPDLEHATLWDFSKYTPHVVVVAIGQNDAHPTDFMKDDYDGKEAENWREHYRQFLLTLRDKYPNAYIICQTTLLMHDEAWDRAIDKVVSELSASDKRISHFVYSLNGRGTPGHLRIPEAEMMAQELSRYIESLGEEVWS